MKKQDIIKAIIDRVRAMIESREFKRTAVTKEKAFTRKRKQSFTGMVTMIMRGMKYGLTRGIRDAIKEELALQEKISNQAFSKQRMFIRPEAFLEIFQVTVDSIIENDMTERYKGFRILAIDGTTYNLPNTAELEAKYGAQKSNAASQVQAKGSCLLDLTSNMILDASFAPYGTNERELAAKHLQFLSERGLMDSLVIMDRGYPSFELLYDFEEKNLHYLARVQERFFKEVRVAKRPDSIIWRKQGDREIRIRVIRIQTNGGKEETLLTNIFSSDFTCDNFKELYRRRWGIETCYDVIKNTLEIEKFSGTSEIAILQDFHASMFLKNIAQVAIWSQDEEVEKRNEERDRKYNYKVNVNAAVDAVRRDLIVLLMEPSWRKRGRMLNALQKKLISKVIPVRPGRSFGDPAKTRKPKHPGCKYHPNRRN